MLLQGGPYKGTDSDFLQTCEGHYQTSTCDAKNDCGLDGVFRGLRIDNNYDFGEWSAVFNGQANSTDVKIEALDMSGKALSCDHAGGGHGACMCGGACVCDFTCVNTQVPVNTFQLYGGDI